MNGMTFGAQHWTIATAATPGGAGAAIPGALEGADAAASAWTLSDAAFVVFLSLLVMFGLTMLVHWWVWLAGMGRFSIRTGDAAPFNLAKVGTDFLFKIIDDFRHFLALIVFLVFFVTLVMVIVAGWADKTKPGITAMLDGIQVVVASLGGLVGSIIGYYYGESAVRRTVAGEDAGDEGATGATGQPRPTGGGGAAGGSGGARGGGGGAGPASGRNDLVPVMPPPSTPGAPAASAPSNSPAPGSAGAAGTTPVRAGGANTVVPAAAPAGNPAAREGGGT